MLKGFLEGQKDCSEEEYKTYLEQVGAKGLIWRKQETAFVVDGERYIGTFTWGKAKPFLLEVSSNATKENHYYTSENLRKTLKLEEYSK